LSTNRNFLKAPSGVYKVNNNNSIVPDENFISNANNNTINRRKNDSTLPKIIYNESFGDSVGDIEEL